MLAIGNNEIKNAEKVYKGDTVICLNCKKPHTLETGTLVNNDGTKTETDMMLFYKCKDKVYLAAIENKLLPKVFKYKE